jgi:dipeptidyl aminopeptidase/acylaminoacyl peptidase
MMFVNRRFAPIALALCALALSTVPCLAGELGYQMPSAEIASLVDAPGTPVVRLSPDRTLLLVLQRPSLVSIESVSEPELRLAGLRINPKNYGPSRQRHYRDMWLQSIQGGDPKTINGLPLEARISHADWSPDSRSVAFVISLEDRLELWVLDATSSIARKLSCPSLNASFGKPFEWMSDSRHLVTRCALSNPGDPPHQSSIPRGPVVQENLGKARPARTHQDLLENPVDEAIFTFYTLAQLYMIDLSGPPKSLGRPDLITEFDPSPDGNRLLVRRLHPPFSYSQPYYRFPVVTEVQDLEGRVIAEIADLPLAEDIPMAFGSVRKGRRGIGWREDTEATLWYVAAQDEGDASNKTEIRDAVYLLAEPYAGEGRLLAKLTLRFSGIQWGDSRLALLSESWHKTRRVKTWRLRLGDEGFEPELLWDRSREDRYGDPGRPLLRRDIRGRNLIHTEDGSEVLYLSGKGASDEGDRPFLDRLDLATGKTRRLFRSKAPWYERPVDLLDANKLILLTQREKVDSPPNYFIRDLKRDRLKTVTDFPHPTPQLSGVSKELIRYSRTDGVELNGTLYLPPDYNSKRDGALPLILWAYPREFKNADAASQVSGSPHRFVRLGWWSPLVYLLAGYAVLDGPSMPIVGEDEQEPNDQFVEQLVSSAQAAVDAVAARGVGDPARVAVGGHSYGAFMTANLLAHSDIFKAGIARSGAYNRTLTPFGFQAEERSLWEAPEIYFAMSPFMHAEKIDEALLLIHGEADNNAGTYPLQSERFFGALKGQGAVTRLVMLPHESHSYRARESVMHMLWEQEQWLDRYVKNAANK